MTPQTEKHVRLRNPVLSTIGSDGTLAVYCLRTAACSQTGHASDLVCFAVCVLR